jgi:hypothetical protein
LRGIAPRWRSRVGASAAEVGWVQFTQFVERVDQIVEKNIKNPHDPRDTHEHENAVLMPQASPHLYTHETSNMGRLLSGGLFGNPALKTDSCNHLVSMNVALLEGHVYHTYNICGCHARSQRR